MMGQWIKMKKVLVVFNFSLKEGLLNLIKWEIIKNNKKKSVLIINNYYSLTKVIQN